MSAYSSITIDSVDVIFDPESISVTTGNLIGINRSMGGTYYITSPNSNTPAINRTISINGALIPATNVSALMTSAAKKTTVVVGGSIIGTTGNFIITSMNHTPIKPRFDYPGNTEIKYAYTINLQEVD